ncbi:MAG: hypothetical protein HQL37_04605 [Alphaproteobacteria bacterium]|nr:hypothetical protein [Alphaproteobacteria bacterium]
MRPIALVLSLFLLAEPAFAQTQPVDAQTAAAPPGSSGIGNVLVVGAGVVVGALVADLLMGGALAASLRSLVTGSAATTAAPTRLLTQAEAVNYKMNQGLVIGEAIRPATDARSVQARTDLLRVAALGQGGAAGWLTAHRFVDN